MVGGYRLCPSSSGSLDGEPSNQKVRLNVKCGGRQIAEESKDHPLNAPRLGPTKGLVVQDSVRSNAMQSNRGTIMDFSPCAVRFVESGCDYMHIVPSAS
jgi:hypothetical protein